MRLLYVSCALAAVAAMFRLFQLPRVSHHLVQQFFGASADRAATAVRVFGHRGFGFEAPENTLAALQRAVGSRLAGVEIDFDFTSDNVAVLLHDSSVDRTTNGTGDINELPFSDVCSLNAAHYMPSFTGHAAVPSLDDAVKFCLQRNLQIMLDLKGDSVLSVRKLCELFAKHPALYERAMVSSFYPQAIYQLRSRDPRIITGLTWRPHFIYRTDIDGPPRPNLSAPLKLLGPVVDAIYAWLFEHVVWRIVGNSVFICHAAIVDSSMVTKWHEREIQVFPWAVNSNDDQQQFMHHIKIPYITDQPSLVP